MNSPVEQIKERLKVEEVISSYIKLEQAGANLKAKCPFHNEKTPSFFVSPDRGSYYCFGCGAKGDIFTFIEEFEGLDFKGALKILAEKAGISLSNFVGEKTGEKDKLYKAMEEATKFFQNNLDSEEKAREYLKERGLEEKSIKEFRIGYIKNDWRLLYNHLMSLGFKDAELEKAGLVKKTEKGYYDRFRGRIMFPISDSSGRVIAFSGRIFGDNSSSEITQAKYLNSPDTPIFNKSAVLYGLDKAKDFIRKNNFSILVEGQMDLVLSHQAGFRNTVATSGTALSDSITSKNHATDELKEKENVVSNLGLLRRLSSNIVLAFDGDEAGFNASLRAGKIALSLGMDVKVADIPEGVDPADLVSTGFDSKNGIESWRQVIRNSKHLIDFLVEKVLLDTKGDMRKAGRDIKDKVLPLVDVLPSSIEKDFFIKKISNLSSISESSLKEDLMKVEASTKIEKEEINKVKNSENVFFRKDYILRKILGIIFWQESLKNKNIDLDKYKKELSEILELNEEDILKENNENKEDLIFEAEIFYKEVESLNKEVGELLNNLQEENLKEKLAQKMHELRIAEIEKDFNKSSSILKECQIINNKIQAIKNK